MKLRAKLRETPSYGMSSRSPVGRAQTLEDHFDGESALSHGHTGARGCTEGGWLCRLRGVQILLELSECLREKKQRFIEQSMAEGLGFEPRRRFHA